MSNKPNVTDWILAIATLLSAIASILAVVLK